MWLANDFNFITFDQQKGSTMSKWTYADNKQRYKINVKLVKEIESKYNLLPLLVICMDYMEEGGLLCVFDITKSKVIRAIKFDEKVRNWIFSKCAHKWQLFCKKYWFLIKSLLNSAFTEFCLTK